jgi:hypothetical protein
MPLSQINSASIENASVAQVDLATGVAGTGPAFNAYANTIQTISATTATKIQFNTERFDTNSAYDNATNYRFQPLVAGYYQINIGVTLNNNVTGDGSYTMIYKNGSCVAVSGAASSGSTYSIPNVASVVYLNGSTDYVEGYLFTQNGPKNTVVNLFGTGDSCVFSGALIRGA